MTEIKIKYYYKRDGKIVHSIYTIQDIEIGLHHFYMSCKIITRCLFTGCLDADGKEIYYGDKVIVFHHGSECWDEFNVYTVGENLFPLPSTSCDLHIIGNIYEAQND